MRAYWVGLVLVAVAGMAAAGNASEREALWQLAPAAMTVIEQMEHERGSRFRSSDLQDIMATPEFLERLKKLRQTDERFHPCKELLR